MHDYAVIPHWVMIDLTAYANEGTHVCGALEAILANDLFEAIARCDEQLRTVIPSIVSFIYNRLPMGCHGSYQILEEWSMLKRQEAALRNKAH